jgi:heme/copper-type cytochrome/quinol oxidase subunit 3
MLLVFSGITIIDTKVTMAGNLGNLAGYLVYTALLSVIFIFICWRTGEPMP